MKKIATLLLLCMALTLFVPTAYAEEKIIPADVKIITIYDGDVGNYFDYIEKGEERKLVEVESRYKRNDIGKKYTAYSEEVLGLTNIIQPLGVVGIGQEFMGFQCIYMAFGPPSIAQYAGLYNEAANVLYYFPRHAFKIVGSEMLISAYEYDGTRGYFVVESKVVPKPVSSAPASAPTTAPAGITVTYNGELINFDQAPVAENGRTLVPLRAIFEKLGATVAWDGNTQTVTATKGDVVITLTLNNTTATKNGQPVILDVPAKAINGRTLVPVRFIADCFGVTTGWDGNLQRVILTD